MTDTLNQSRAFLMIPASVAHDQTLLKQPKAIILLGEIVSMLNVTGVFYINNNTLSKRLDCTKRSIINYLDLLEKRDLVRRKFFKNDDGKVVKREITAGKGLTRAFANGWAVHDEIEFTTPGETAFTTPSETEFTTPVKYVSTKESINKENNNNRNIYSPAEAEPPVSQKNNSVFKQIIDYLNDKAKRNFKYTNKSTQRLINARVNDGYDVADFKKVIDNKCAQWLNDKKMYRYLRPDTLFGPKFEGYLNENVPGMPMEQEMDPRMLAKVPDEIDDDLPF
ncbi:conserved phage C-terminal domain-containing protein [Lactobacillus sp. ESL0681]|uniref:conserved phage C-terminal domain-containing protein n=1 Tax=Lactobacillus sp. ESL0681 TaxID=2983211 RepID=UPI0023F9D1A1|nr:conserved phage C-terminal domain-containing protein [Lactobacillus sp. ESL0681]WEV40335.1 conserved phage C-terminal domain-containing protein [Lactobacillus sp. ESL0681]